MPERPSPRRVQTRRHQRAQVVDEYRVQTRAQQHVRAGPEKLRLELRKVPLHVRTEPGHGRVAQGPTAEHERNGRLVRREVVAGDAHTQALQQIGTPPQRSREGAQVHHLAQCIRGEWLEHRLFDAARLERRGQRGRVRKQVPMRAIRRAVLGHTIKRLVLTDAAAQQHLEHTSHARAFVYPARGFERRTESQAGQTGTQAQKSKIGRAHV